jgi:hypothetical protein
LLLRGGQIKSQPLWSLKSERSNKKKKEIVLQNSVINKWERNLNFASIRAHWWLIYQREKSKQCEKFSEVLAFSAYFLLILRATKRLVTDLVQCLQGFYAKKTLKILESDKSFVWPAFPTHNPTHNDSLAQCFSNSLCGGTVKLK